MKHDTELSVMKFGGAAVSTPDHFHKIAEIIAHRKKRGGSIVAVVSAMGNTTDELIALALKVHPNPPQREYDMLVTVGERISVALLAMALHRIGVQATSFTGSQSGIITTNDHTEAKIVDVRPKRLVACLEANKIAIVAGFQGVSLDGEITTLGRGGSDTTAVAIAAALNGNVEFYKDVKGFYSDDPKKNPEAVLFPYLSYEEALKVVSKGGRILHRRSIELAQKNGIHLSVRSFLEEGGGSVIADLSHVKNSRPIYETEPLSILK